MSIASEITRLQNAKASIKTSIENKGVTVPSSTTLDGYSTLIDSIPTSSSVVNGIIEQYKASTSTIDANTFVEFINASGGSATSVSSYYMYSKAVLIDTDKVFVAFNDNSNYYAKAVVCTINDFTITVGTITSIYGGSSGNGWYIDTAKLDTNKVFMVYRGSSKYLQGIVCNVSGSTISKGSSTTLVSSAVSDYSRISVLSTTKVLVTHGTTLNGIVCTISGTTISKGSDTTIKSNANSGYANSLSLIDTDKVLVTSRTGGSASTTADNLEATVLSISGTTITKGTITKIADYCGGNGSTATGAVYYAVRQILIEPNKALILHANNLTSHYINGIVCSINGTTISKGSDTLLASSDMGEFYSTSVDGALIGTNKTIIVYSTNKLECKISGTTIKKKRDVTFYGGGTFVTLALLDSSRVYLSYRSSDLKGIVKSLEYLAKPSTTKIEGLTKTECTTSTAGDVWVLNV